MIILDLLGNYVITASVAAWLLAQITKFFVAWFVDGKPDPHRLFGDGGMPSAHSATVVCLTVMIGYGCGVGSPIFALAFLFAIIVMHDATGVRRETGKQAMDIVQLFEALNDILSEKDKITQREKLKTFVGHSPVQVFCGALLGILVGVLYIVIAGI